MKQENIFYEIDGRVLTRSGRRRGIDINKKMFVKTVGLYMILYQFPFYLKIFKAFKKR